MTTEVSIISPLKAPLRPPLGLASGAAGYTTTAVDYDGSNDYATRGADLTGSADGSVGMFSFWMNAAALGSAILYNTSGFDVEILLLSDGDLRIRLYNTVGTLLVNLLSTGTPISTSAGWQHVLISWDLSDATAGNNWCYIYVDGNQEAADESITQELAINYTETNHSIGAYPNGADKYAGCLSEFYANFAESLKPTTAANIEKFRGADGKPVDLGADGSTPTGTAPIIYAPDGDPSDNKGSGGNFTITGALAACSSSPTD